MTEKPNEHGFLISEEFLDQGPSQLEGLLLEALDRDRVGMADKWWACLDSNQGLLLPKQQA